MGILDTAPNWLAALVFSVLAGITIPLGAWLARVEHIRPNWLEEELRHFIIAFGGGVLIAAVSLVLIPEGIKGLNAFGALVVFLGGGAFFCWLDRYIQKRGGHYSQLIAMLADFLPEALALGAMITERSATTMLLAFLIALQNLPEGFNAYREIVGSSDKKPKRVMMWFCALVLVGPLAALVGEEVLSHSKTLLGVVMVFSAGGIMYLVFQDIAPEARMRKHWTPPLGAVCGFALGLLGHMVL